jgi:hypothetical protein
MKKLLFIILACVALACGDSNRSDNDNRDRSKDREAAAEEDVDIGAGEEISPQLELDSADRFKVDTISSPDEANKEADDNSF